MKLSELKTGTKLIGGFSLIAIIGLIVGFISFSMSLRANNAMLKALNLSSISGDVKTALEAHTEWKSKIEESFLLNKESIDVQLDGHKCGFGKWYYEGGLTKLNDIYHTGAETLRNVEELHLKLHSTAKEINNEWAQVHEGLIDKLLKRLADHQNWALKVSIAVINNKKVDVETNPEKCAFGKYLKSMENIEIQNSWPEYKSIMKEII